MRFTKTALALFACLTFTAIAANAAQAQWTVETASGAKDKIVSESVRCQKHPGMALTLESKLLGSAISISAEEVECENATIETQTTAMNTEHSTGFLKFTGVKVESNETCMLPNNAITTNELTDQVFMDENVAGSPRVFDRFFPENAEGIFFQFELTGALCPLAGNIVVVKGSFCGELVHTKGTEVLPSVTGEFNVNNILSFGMTQQTTGNSTTYPCLLKVGKEEATINGTVSNELSGANAGRPFAAG